MQQHSSSVIVARYMEFHGCAEVQRIRACFECAHKHPHNCQIRNHKVLRRIILMSMVAPWRWLRCSLCELGLVDDGGRATGQLAVIPDTQCLTFHKDKVSPNASSLFSLASWKWV